MFTHRTLQRRSRLQNRRLEFEHLEQMLLLACDINNDGTLDARDIDYLSERMGTASDQADLNRNGRVDEHDLIAFVEIGFNTLLGDSNLDGEFNSSDLVQVFTAGKYETDLPAGWAEGDWNGDGLFSSTDLPFQFRKGGYGEGPRLPLNDAGNSLVNADDLGPLPASREIEQSIGLTSGCARDPVDVFQFSLDVASVVSAQLSGPTLESANLYLIKDRDQNGLFDRTFDVVSSLDADMGFVETLPSGTYYLLVEPAGPPTAQRYSLLLQRTVSAEEVRKVDGISGTYNKLFVADQLIYEELIRSDGHVLQFETNDKGDLHVTEFVMDPLGEIDLTTNRAFPVDVPVAMHAAKLTSRHLIHANGDRTTAVSVDETTLLDSEIDGEHSAQLIVDAGFEELNGESIPVTIRHEFKGLADEDSGYVMTTSKQLGDQPEEAIQFQTWLANGERTRRFPSSTQPNTLTTQFYDASGSVVAVEFENLMASETTRVQYEFNAENKVRETITEVFRASDDARHRIARSVSTTLENGTQQTVQSSWADDGARVERIWVDDFLSQERRWSSTGAYQLIEHDPGYVCDGMFCLAIIRPPTTTSKLFTSENGSKVFEEFIVEETETRKYFDDSNKDQYVFESYIDGRLVSQQLRIDDPNGTTSNILSETQYSESGKVTHSEYSQDEDAVTRTAFHANDPNREFARLVIKNGEPISIETHNANGMFERLRYRHEGDTAVLYQRFMDGDLQLETITLPNSLLVTERIGDSLVRQLFDAGRNTPHPVYFELRSDDGSGMRTFETRSKVLLEPSALDPIYAYDKYEETYNNGRIVRVQATIYRYDEQGNPNVFTTRQEFDDSALGLAGLEEYGESLVDLAENADPGVADALRDHIPILGGILAGSAEEYADIAADFISDAPKKIAESLEELTVPSLSDFGKIKDPGSIIDLSGVVLGDIRAFYGDVIADVGISLPDVSFEAGVPVFGIPDLSVLENVDIPILDTAAELADNFDTEWTRVLNPVGGIWEAIGDLGVEFNEVVIEAGDGIEDFVASMLEKAGFDPGISDLNNRTPQTVEIEVDWSGMQNVFLPNVAGAVQEVEDAARTLSVLIRDQLKPITTDLIDWTINDPWRTSPNQVPIQRSIQNSIVAENRIVVFVGERTIRDIDNNGNLVISAATARAGPSGFVSDNGVTTEDLDHAQYRRGGAGPAMFEDGWAVAVGHMAWNTPVASQQTLAAIYGTALHEFMHVLGMNVWTNEWTSIVQDFQNGVGDYVLETDVDPATNQVTIEQHLAQPTQGASWADGVTIVPAISIPMLTGTQLTFTDTMLLEDLGWSIIDRNELANVLPLDDLQFLRRRGWQIPGFNAATLGRNAAMKGEDTLVRDARTPAAARPANFESETEDRQNLRLAGESLRQARSMMREVRLEIVADQSIFPKSDRPERLSLHAIGERVDLLDDVFADLAVNGV